MSVDLPLTRGRLSDAGYLLGEAKWALEVLQKDYPSVVGDLPERLAVLQGLTERHEFALCEKWAARQVKAEQG